MAISRLILVYAMVTLLASGYAHADALTDYLQGKGTYVPPAAKSVLAPAKPVAALAIPGAVATDILELPMTDDRQGLARRAAEWTVSTAAWHGLGEGLKHLTGSQIAPFLVGVLEGIKDVGGTPTHRASVIAASLGEDKVLGRPTLRVGEPFAVACVSAPGSNANALPAEIRLERQTPTLAGGSEWATLQRVPLNVNPQGPLNYLLLPHWVGSADKPGAYRVKCQRNVFGDQIRAFEFHAVARMIPSGFDTLQSEKLLTHYFGERYRKAGCRDRSPCVEMRRGDKGAARYPKMNLDVPLEASIHTVKTIGNEAVVIFEITAGAAWAHWDYLKLVQTDVRWREAIHSYGEEEVSGSFGIVSSIFTPLLVGGKVMGIAEESSYSQMGNTTRHLTIYSESGMKLARVLNVELAGASPSYWFSKDPSNRLPDVFLARTPDHEGPRLSASYRFDGQMYREAEPRRRAKGDAARPEVALGRAKATAGAMFQLVSTNHHMSDDLDAVCRRQVGNGYRLADWNDIRAQYRSGMKPDAILASGSAFVSVAENRFWKRGRHYIATRANHRRDSGYLAHDTIDNQLFDLGSWYPSYPVLCFKKR